MDRILCIATAAQASVGYCNSALQTVRQEPAPVLVLCNKMLFSAVQEPMYPLGPSSGSKFSIVLLRQVLLEIPA